MAKSVVPFLAAVCCLVLAYAAWTGGGAASLAGCVFLLSGGLLILALLWAQNSAPFHGHDSSPVRRDPLFWIGAVFMSLLTVQMFNSGRWLYFNPVEDRWMHTAPLWRGLPWSFRRAEALEMLAWFLPAWALALTLRHARDARRIADFLLWFLVFNGLFLGLLGLAQTVGDADDMFWRIPRRAPFFASFAYRNHAAAYFALILGAAGGLFIRELRRLLRHDPRTTMARVFAAGAATVTALIAAAVSSSRTGVLIGVVALGAGLLGVAGYVRRTHRRIRQVSALLTVIMSLGIIGIWIVLIGTQRGWEPERRLFTMDPSAEIATRGWQIDAALRIWRDHPWFGTGGWGYAHLLPLYTDLRPDRIGAANVHNDAVQFLVEFGLVGSGLLAASLIVLAVGYRRAWGRYARNHSSSTGLVMAVFLGLLAVMAHSLYDLPFRNPAILLTWTTLLSAVPAGCVPVRQN